MLRFCPARVRTSGRGALASLQERGSSLQNWAAAVYECSGRRGWGLTTGGPRPGWEAAAMPIEMRSFARSSLTGAQRVEVERVRGLAEHVRAELPTRDVAINQAHVVGAQSAAIQALDRTSPFHRHSCVGSWPRWSGAARSTRGRLLRRRAKGGGRPLGPCLRLRPAQHPSCGSATTRGRELSPPSHQLRLAPWTTSHTGGRSRS